MSFSTSSVKASKAQTSKEMRRRTWITLGLWLSLWVWVGIPLPGLQGQGQDPTMLGLFGHNVLDGLSLAALWLAPVISAYLLVEWIALLVPRWRALRWGGCVERARLYRATVVIAVILISIQSWGLATFLETNQRLISSGLVAKILTSLFIGLGTAWVWWVAWAISRYGIGHGFSVVLTVPIFRHLFSWGSELVRQIRAELIPPLLVVGSFVLLGGVLWMTLRLLRHSPWQQGIPSLPPLYVLPLCGLIPLTQAENVLVLLQQHLGLSHLLSTGRGFWSLYSLVFLLLVFGLVWLCSRMFFLRTNIERYVKIQEFYEKGRSNALLWSGGYVFALALVSLFFVVRLGLEVQVVSFVTLLVIGHDWNYERRTIAKHGALVSVWPIHRLYTMGLIKQTLHNAGIPCCMRGLGHRSLLHFFGPHIEVGVLVPKVHQEEAKRLIATCLSGVEEEKGAGGGSQERENGEG